MYTVLYICITVELFGSMSNFGISLGFPAGIVCEKFGPRIASLCGLIIASAGFTLLWSATLTEEFYSNKAGLQDIYYFISGNWYTVISYCTVWNNYN